MNTQQATAIAQSYLEEIATKAFTSGSCPSPTGGRSTYQSICNYNGLNESPHDQTGAAISGLSRYTVSVTVDSSAAVLKTLSGSTKVVRIDVSVSHPSMTSVQVSTYRTNHA